MFINDDKTHLFNLKEAFSVLQNIFGSNAETNDDLSSKVIEVIVERKVQKALVQDKEKRLQAIMGKHK